MIKGNLKLIKTFEDGQKVESMAQNDLTSLFENIILSRSVGSLISSNMGSEAGVNQAFTPQRYVINNNRMNTNKKEDLFTIYLLNLNEEERLTLNKDIKNNPVLNPDGSINHDKLVGYATCLYTPSKAKEGYLTVLDSNIVTDSKKYGIAFKWNAGTLNGTFNTIVIGTNVTDTPYNGFLVSRGLDTNNKILSEAESTGYFLTQNCKKTDGTILTTENEILLGNGASLTKARRVLNLLTGENINLQPGDARYDVPLINKPHTAIGNGNIIIKDGTYIYIKDIMLNTNIKSFHSGRNVGGGFALFNNFLYVKSSDSNDLVLKAYDLVDFNLSADNNITMTIPADFSNPELYSLSEYGEDFILTTNTETTCTKDSKGIIFSDLSSPATSIKGSYIGALGSSLIVGGKVVYIVNKANSSDMLDNEIDYLMTTAGTTTSVSRRGVKMITEDYIGNVLTFSKLVTPITITTNDAFELHYYFNF